MATALAIAEEKRLVNEIEAEAKNVDAWAKRALLATEANDDSLAQETLARKSEHTDRLNKLRAQWHTQHALISDLKKTLLRFDHVIEHAKHIKSRLKKQRLERHANELKDQVVRMEQLVKGLESSAEDR